MSISVNPRRGPRQRCVVEHEGLRYQSDENNRAVVSEQIHVLIDVVATAHGVAAQVEIECKIEAKLKSIYHISVSSA